MFCSSLEEKATIRYLPGLVLLVTVAEYRAGSALWITAGGSGFDGDESVKH